MPRSLIRLVCILSAVLVLATGVQAQKTFKINVGPYFLAGASVFSGDVPYTWKTDLKFAFSGGVMSTYNTSPRFGINLGLAYDSRNIFFYDEDEKNITNKINLSTFDIYAGAKFSDFMIGFAFGFPMNGEMTLNDGAGHELVAGEQHFSADSMGIKIDLRLGAAFNIVESDVGKLQFMIQAAYPLSTIWDHTPYAMRRLLPPGANQTDIDVENTPAPGTTNTRSFENGVTASIQFGFAYQFNLGGNL